MPGGLTFIRNVKFADLLEYDTAHFPARREKFLRCWIAQEGHFGLARLDDDRDDPRLRCPAEMPYGL